MFICPYSSQGVISALFVFYCFVVVVVVIVFCMQLDQEQNSYLLSHINLIQILFSIFLGGNKLKLSAFQLYSSNQRHNQIVLHDGVSLKENQKLVCV